MVYSCQGQLITGKIKIKWKNLEHQLSDKKHLKHDCESTTSLHNYYYYDGFVVKPEGKDNIQVLRNNHYKLKNGKIGMFTGYLLADNVNAVKTILLAFQIGKFLEMYPLDYITEDLGNSFGMDLHKMLLTVAYEEE